MDTLGQYILDLCDKQNLSMRQASIRAGLSEDTIGVIVRRDTRPRPETLKAISEGIDGDFQLMMILAGHIEPPSLQGFDREVVALGRQLQEEWQRLIKADPEHAVEIMRSTIIQAQALRVALEAIKEREGVTEE